LYYEAIHDTLQQIDLIHRLHHAFPNYLHIARSSRDARQIFQSSNHLTAGMIGLEGLHQIGNSASVMRTYHQLGVRYITLTHDCNNRYADAALAAKPKHGGLSDAGRELIKEMNRLGMMMDLSHVSAATMRDALRVTKAPVIFSHSNAHALCPHPRNVPDDVLKMVQRNGGVVMVTFYPEYLACDDPASASLQHVADNILYIGGLIGYDYVGIGSDFDGMAKGATGLEDVSKYPDLLRELIRRGLNSRQLECLIGNNVLRVLGQVEEVSSEMHDVPPLEDFVRPFFGNSSYMADTP
jgi:membrane dipeptidase